MGNAERMQRMRERRREAHSCIRCGRQDAGTLSGRVYCAECSERDAAYRRQRRASGEAVDYTRKMRVQRREKHLCVRCGRQDSSTLAGRQFCSSCGEKELQRQRERRNNPSFIQRERADKKADYDWCKAHHFCVSCKTQDAFTLSGRVYCADCSEKRKAQRAERSKRPDHAKASYEAKHASDQKRYYERKAAGLCVHCARPTYGLGTSCERCRLKQKRKRVSKTQIQGINWPRGDNDICYVCNKRPVFGRYHVCEECLGILQQNLQKTYGGEGPTAKRPEDHPFRLSDKRRVKAILEKKGRRT